VAQSKLKARQRRHERVRKTVYGTATRPRLSVFKSLSHIYAQIIDDTTGKTIIAASSTEKTLHEGLKHCGNVEAAKKVGASIAERALGREISNWLYLTAAVINTTVVLRRWQMLRAKRDSVFRKRHLIRRRHWQSDIKISRGKRRPER